MFGSSRTSGQADTFSMVPHDCHPRSLFCGLCYANMRARESHKGHRGWRKYRKAVKVMGKWVVPSKGLNGRGTGGPDWVDPAFARAHPALAGWLGETVDDSGKARETGTLLLFVDGGLLKCCLRDRTTGYVAFVSAGTLEALLGALEDGLRDGDLDWRESREQKQNRK